ncbi:MAG: hypothetical protein BGO49_00025 [Planctomycetales bacterium 71-10]|nr:MAG: hypothetical protein BGO49_00025 [Planctomycetales bacterium 71-10]
MTLAYGPARAVMMLLALFLGRRGLGPGDGHGARPGAEPGRVRLRRELLLVGHGGRRGTGPARRELTVLDIASAESTTVGDTPVDGDILSFCRSPDGKRIAHVWREITLDACQEGAPNREAESRLVVCDPDGKNAGTIASEKGAALRAITLGRVDWR